MSPENVFYFEAFWELSSDRQIGMGLGEIPFSAIDRYAVRYKIVSVDRFDEFRRVMRRMDAEYRSLATSKSKGDEAENGETVSANDTNGIKSMLARFNARFRAKNPSGTS